MRLHLNKKAIRALGVAESFEVGERHSRLAGVVMRADRVIDGFVLGRATVEGDDATASIERMYRRLDRNDVNVIMLSGCIISMYNIVDVDGLAEKLGVPVLCVTFKESRGIAGAIRHHFRESSSKLEAYRRLGKRSRVVLGTGHSVYYRANSLNHVEVAKLLNLFTIQGAIPEPVRLARLLARTVPMGS